MLIVYSAIYGKKDYLRIPPDVNYRFVLFTDEDVVIPKWEVVKEKGKYDCPNLSAKWFKLHSHELFPNSNTLWIDGRFMLRKAVEPLLDAIGNNIFAGFKHYSPTRTIKSEADFCIKHNKSDINRMKNQIDKYKEYYDEKVIQGNCLFRSPSVKPFNNIWWEEILNGSSRDQISLVPSLKKSGISYIALNQELQGEFFKKGNHLR